MKLATMMVPLTLIFSFTVVVSGWGRSVQAQDVPKPSAPAEAGQPKAGQFKAGQIALVVRDRARLMNKDDVLLRMQLGSEFTVQEVRDEWIGGLVRLPGQPRTGWVRTEDLVPLDVALPRFRQLLTRTPRDFNLLLVNARLLRDQEKWDAALGLYDRAASVSPQDKRALQQRGYLHYLRSDYKLADRDYSRALKIDAKDVLSYTNRGLNRQALGLTEQALRDYDRAMQLSDRNALAMNNAAWLRATCTDDKLRDGKLALGLALGACELTDFANFDFLDTLAAAHAESGQFDKALEFVSAALKQAPDEYKSELKQRQALYKTRKPFRDKSLED